MGTIRQMWIRCTGMVSWRKASHQAYLMSKFAATEQGSSYDMLSAIENTQYPELKHKYLHHAIDEARHARLFRSRAFALGVDREQAARIDIGYLHDNGIVGGETLCERLGEHKFLAFVHDAENRGLEHFLIYLNSPHTDAQTKEALQGITKDEHFHRAYSKAALEKYVPEQADSLLRAVRIRRYKEAWMRMAKSMATTLSSFWLTLFYVVFVTPFRIFTRPEPAGWIQTTEEIDIQHAKRQF